MTIDHRDTGQRDDHRQVWAFFLGCSAVLIAAGIVIPMSVHDGAGLWALASLGALIIIALLAAAAVPHLRQH